VLSRLKDGDAVKKLFDEIGPKYVTRFGGYTRILKLGFRHGDNSPVSLIEFVGDEMVKKVTRKAKSAGKQAKPVPEASTPAQHPAEE
ncbi:MAG: bL17 family ribosomal protein, partial [Candidatus Latescibacterota bacterium]